MIYWLLVIMIVVSYFFGNINFGRIISQAKNVDLSKKGSGNLGATNMFRNLGAKLGYLTMVLDISKGVIPALAGFLVFGAGTIEGFIGLYACGLGAIVGHIFPVIYNFKGGKGIACMVGVFLVAQPIPMLIIFVIAFIFVWFFKYVSVASLLIATIMVVYQNLVLTEPNLPISMMTFAIFLLTWFAHRSNIERLLRGKETKTNIQRKIFRDKKRLQKLEEKAVEKAEKLEEKAVEKAEKQELKQEKQELKREKKEVKAEIKEEKAELKKELKLVKEGQKGKKKKEPKKKSTKSAERKVPRFVKKFKLFKNDKKES